MAGRTDLDDESIASVSLCRGEAVRRVRISALATRLEANSFARDTNRRDFGRSYALSKSS